LNETQVDKNSTRTKLLYTIFHDNKVYNLLGKNVHIFFTRSATCTTSFSYNLINCRTIEQAEAERARAFKEAVEAKKNVSNSKIVDLKNKAEIKQLNIEASTPSTVVVAEAQKTLKDMERAQEDKQQADFAIGQVRGSVNGSKNGSRRSVKRCRDEEEI
jgi:Rps23 Pro-64 3,4-dihydroxylase Tpa1-like proline 4-hydroxylase